MSQTLELLKQLAHGLAVQFGSSCEIVIHDLTRKNLESSIAYIENGTITHRAVGGGPSNIVLETLKRDPAVLNDRLAYLTRTDDGRILKSSTMYIRGENGKIDYIFSLNYDITGLMAAGQALEALTSTSGQGTDRKPERITRNINDLLDDLLDQSMAIAGKPVAMMTKDDKIQAIRFLDNAGAFLITKSGDKVSSRFNISKFTLYSYLDAARQSEEK